MTKTPFFAEQLERDGKVVETMLRTWVVFNVKQRKEDTPKVPMSRYLPKEFPPLRTLCYNLAGDDLQAYERLLTEYTLEEVFELYAQRRARYESESKGTME